MFNIDDIIKTDRTGLNQKISENDALNNFINDCTTDQNQKINEKVQSQKISSR